jgi:tetratricopeptide (TPR) repeat protein
MDRIKRLLYSARIFILAGVLFVVAGVVFWRGHTITVSVKPAAVAVIPLGVPDFLKQAAEAEVTGKLLDAISAYEKVLEIDPGYALVYLKLGVIYFHLGLPTKAEELYLMAIEKGLSDPDIYVHLGYIKESQGKLDQALEYYAKGELSASSNPVLYFNMGNVYARQGRNDKALGYFKRAVIIKSDYLDAFVNLAIISAQIGEYSDAQYYLEKAEKQGYVAPVEFKEGLAKKLAKNASLPLSL